MGGKLWEERGEPTGKFCLYVLLVTGWFNGSLILFLELKDLNMIN